MKTRVFDVEIWEDADENTDGGVVPAKLEVKITDEGIIVDLWDVKGENVLETWGMTAQEFVSEIFDRT